MKDAKVRLSYVSEKVHSNSVMRVIKDVIIRKGE
jgi:hypothetical protein